MRPCARAGPAHLPSLLCLLALPAWARACTFFAHERSILSDLPFACFSIESAEANGQTEQSLLKCAQHAAAFNVSAASLGVIASGERLCTLYNVATEACPGFEQSDAATAATAVAACNPAAVATVTANVTDVPPAASRAVIGSVSAQRFLNAVAVGGVLRGRVHARAPGDCLELCAKWIEPCDTVVVDNVTRIDSGVLICSLHAAARAQALPSPGFDLYVGVRVATEEELASAQEAAPGEVGGSANASAPAPAPQAGLGNLDAALGDAAAKAPSNDENRLMIG